MSDKPSSEETPPKESESEAAEEARKPSPKLVRLFKIFTIFFSLVFALIFGEVLARAFTSDYYLQTRKSDGGILIPFEPNTSAELVMDEFRAKYDINKFGYRDKLDRSEKKPQGKKRVLLLGDSFSAGWGVEFPEIYSSQLEEGLGAEFVNAAKNGGCALWYIHQARYAAPKFEVDGVVIQIFDNDLIDCERSKKSLEVVDGQKVGPLPADLDPRQFGLSKGFSKSFNKLILRRKLRNLRRRIAGKTLHRQAYVKVGAFPDHKVLNRQEVREKWGPQLVAPPKWNADFDFHKTMTKAWSKRIVEHNQYLSQLIDECQAAQRPVFVIYIPCYQIFLRGMNKSQLQATNSFAQSLKELCKEKNTAFFDSSVTFFDEPKPEELYFLFDGHLNAAGHKKLAEALKEPMSQYLNSLKQ